MHLLLLILSGLTLVIAIVASTGKCPVWLAPILAAIVLCLMHFPK